MNKRRIFTTLLILSFSLTAFSQAATDVAVRILKAEDERRYDGVLENLLTNADQAIRARAALAAGRIGDEKAIDGLSMLLGSGNDEKVRVAAVFALGEIESIKGANAILALLNDPNTPGPIRAKAVEAAGKIAAANAKDEQSKVLGKAILDTLEAENNKGVKQNRDVVLLGITAALRARPENTGVVVAKFLTNPDARIRADAANTLSRVRAKNANETLRTILLKDGDAVARANAARALGAAEDKDAFNVLLAAIKDRDSRVRVSAIRSVAALKDARAADILTARGEKLLAEYRNSKFAAPSEKHEMLEIATALGSLLANTGNARAFKFLGNYAALDKGQSPEIYVARFRIAPGKIGEGAGMIKGWRQYVMLAQVISEFAGIEPKTDEVRKLKSELPGLVLPLAKAYVSDDPEYQGDAAMAGPDIIRAFAKYKTDDLAEMLRRGLTSKDIFIRAASAELLAELPASKENIEILKTAFGKSLSTDKAYNDAQLGILDAIYKLDKKESAGTLVKALNAPDYLVRKKAFDLLKDIPEASAEVANAITQRKNQVLPYAAASGTKQGQILNTPTAYRNAALRKNGKVKAILTTEKGAFTIDLLPEDAPLTVDNFIKLANSGYFNGLEVHRVVPNFVMQDGDPRGDGNGGPGWSIRCELNTVPFERGVVGMALSGKDTGGSQWFVTHAPQPHLDGGYTVFGRVNETGMKIVDKIVRGDRIISVKIVEEKLLQKRSDKVR